jgi:hypothetical protein
MKGKREETRLFSGWKPGRTDNVRERSWKAGERIAVSGKRSLAPDMTSNEAVLSASEGDDGETGHLALLWIEEIRGWMKKEVRDSSHAP